MIKIILVLLYAVWRTCTISAGEISWPPTLNQDLEIPVKKLASNPIYSRNYRYDNNDRNTSAEYDLWDKAGFYLFEWPGNVTILDPNFPLLKWEHQRARLLRSPCEKERGMELAVYAYKYLHLTWGGNYLTKSYCNPLRVNRKHLPDQERENKDTEISIVDFDFIFDGLLVVTKEGYVIRVTDIEINYRLSVKPSSTNLTYSLSKGITGRINRVISQKCCSKAKDSCPHGDAVIAYHEMSSSLTVFISYNGGKYFDAIQLQASHHSNNLYGSLFYPNWKRIVMLHGVGNTVLITEHSANDGALIGNRKKVSIEKNGYLQATRIGNEMEFVMWDDCTVWYAQIGKSGIETTPAVFYLHSTLLKDIGEFKKSRSVPHVIRSKHCHFGRLSSFQLGDEGKLGFLDENNLFFYGVDLKRNDFRLVGLATDLTLLLPRKKKSVVLGFDRNNRPKLFYPPRYLRLPKEDLMDSDYSKRLSMRIVPKTMFPSDFMEPFYKENLEHFLPTNYSQLALFKCQTSTLSINGAITQKPKSYTLSPESVLSLYVTFQGIQDFKGDLEIDPALAENFLDVQKTLIQSEQVDIYKWFRFNVNITLKDNYFDNYEDQQIFLVNIYTTKSLRCVHQPHFPIWIKIDKGYKPPGKTFTRREKDRSCLMEGQHAKIQHCPLQAQLDDNNGKNSEVCSGFGSLHSLK